MLIEGRLELIGDFLRRPTFYVLPLQHMYQLTVLEEAYLWGRRWIPNEVAASPLNRIQLHAGKHGGQTVRFAVA
jgi:hypothetical protein